MSELTAEKSASNFPSDAISILDAMSFDGTNTVLVGSMALRSQQYAGDYDAFEVVYATSVPLHTRFKQLIQRVQALPNAILGDIKAGVIDEWKVTQPSHLKTIPHLTKTEEEEALGLLKEGEEVKFHIVRWTPNEIIKGQKTLRDGRVFTVDEALHCPSIVKVDVIGWVANNRYTEFSNIYEFHDGKKVLNRVDLDIDKSLKDSIKTYTAKGDYFKALKRKFALAKFKGDEKEMKHLQPILNGDLGRLYQVYSDVKTLLYLLENGGGDVAKMKFEIDQFKSRLSNIYLYKGFIKAEPALLTKLTACQSKSRPALRKALTPIAEEMFALLNAPSIHDF